MQQPRRRAIRRRSSAATSACCARGSPTRKFFFDQDRKAARSTSRLPKLASVVYHNKLGTQARRASSGCAGSRARIAPALGADADARRPRGAAREGRPRHRHGRRVPRAAGHDGPLLRAARRRAAPTSPTRSRSTTGRASPATRCRTAPVAQAVALADKLEALAGLFGIGQVPTGDKDPFGLRRAALGVVRILVEKQLDAAAVARWSTLAFAAFDGVAGCQARAATSSRLHLRPPARLPARAGRHGEPGRGACSRAAGAIAVAARRGSPRCRRSRRCPKPHALAAANKRIVNILRKSRQRSRAAASTARGSPTGAEHDLYAAFERLAPHVDGELRRRRLHRRRCKALATAKPVVDRYFDDVMVMADDPAVRANRLALLRGVAATMNRVADIVEARDVKHARAQHARLRATLD